MDIAKYIGLFLLKNHFCYVHGLGNMEVRKLPSTYDNKTIKAPSYEVIVTPGGSIDDNLANFIAVNEQISISKAANALRDFSVQARKDLADGKVVAIPSIGHFADVNGKISFFTDEHFQFTPAGVPTVKNSRQLDEQNAKLTQQKPSFPPPQKADSVNWSMVTLVVLLLLILGGGAYGVFYYLNHSKVSVNPNIKPSVDTPVAARVPVPATVALVDTTHAHDTASAASAAPATAAQMVADTLLQHKSYRMVIGDYPTHDRAERRMKNLTIIGNKVDILRRDSSNFLIYMDVNCPATDTFHFKDSLSRLFGYKGVFIVK